MIGLLLVVVFEVVCYWLGKIAIAPFGFQVSLDDNSGVPRKRRAKASNFPKVPAAYRKNDQRFLRSDWAQVIGAVVLLMIGAGIWGLVLVISG